MRKFYRQDSDEPHFDLTPATEKAIAWLGTLTARSFVGTESRLLTLFELLKQMSEGSESDPETRLAELHKRRAEIDAEIARAEAGDISILDDTALKDRLPATCRRHVQHGGGRAGQRDHRLGQPEGQRRTADPAGKPATSHFREIKMLEQEHDATASAHDLSSLLITQPAETEKGYRQITCNPLIFRGGEGGIEPSTFALRRRCSTTSLK